MAKFTTRIQLNGDPTWSDYDDLHTAMRRNNFTQTIVSDDGITYPLPHAEYNRDASLTLAEVFASAKQAAELVWDDFAVLVTESYGRIWHNLEKVQ